jgi:NAD(P)-dependent dehydrogenase (short-subunit alcohol dehydrogenase family)
MNRFSLEGKTALVSGAASGIGLAVAAAMAEAGAAVYLTDIQADAGRAAAASIPQQPVFLHLDVTQEASCRQAAEEVLARAGRLDILVNNAGIGGVGTLLQTSGEDLDRMYAVNVRGVFNLTKAFLPSMVERRAGSIINIASIGGIVGIQDRLAYCTTKFAVVGFTRCLALDHAKQGVRANAICPGRVETPFVQQRLREYPDPEQAYREMSATQPIGRMARPDEVASVAVFLAGEGAAFITGDCLMVDGGWSAG